MTKQVEFVENSEGASHRATLSNVNRPRERNVWDGGTGNAFSAGFVASFVRATQRGTLRLPTCFATLASVLACAACGSSTPDEQAASKQKVPAASDVATVRAALNPAALNGPADYYSAVMAAGPIGYWRLGEMPSSDHTAHDEMHAMDGTYAGAALQSGDSATALLPQLDLPGAIVGDRNAAAYFFASHDATHSYDANMVQVPATSVPNVTTFTLECWVTMPSNSTGEPTWGTPIIRTTNNMADGYGIVAYSSTINLYVNSSNSRVGVPFPALRTAPNSNTTQHRFHHVVGTYAPPSATIPAGEMKIYLDGVLGATRAGSDVGAVKNGTGPLRIGLGWGAWVGKIDEVALYNKVLDAKTIKDHYEIGIGTYPLVPPTSPNPTYSNAVWVSAQASTGLKAIAADLADTLHTITGQPFSVSSAATAPSDSIQLIRYQGYTPATPAENDLLNPSIPFQYNLQLAARPLNAFAAISEPNTTNGLKFIALSDAGLQMATSFYLKVLGARFLLPNSKWTFLPTRSSIRWNVARIEQPDIPWGADFNVPGDDPGFGPDATFHADWQRWKARNLLINGIDFGNAGADSFNQRNTLKSNNNPLGDSLDTMGDTYATTNNPQTGTPTSHPDWRAHDSSDNPIAVTTNFGWHVAGNTAFQTFFKNDRLAEMATTRAADPNSPASLAVSTEQPQGATEDASPSATSPSNSVATLANAVAAGINTTYPNQGRYASFFAYGAHSAVPTITLSGNVLVTLFPGNQNTGLAPDDFFNSWIGKAALGMNDYWAAADRDLEQPKLDMFTELPRRIRLWYPNGLAGIRNTSTTAAGASGLPWYIAAQLVWNTHILDADERDNMFDLAFGPDQSPNDSARAQMKTMLQRWAGGFSLTQTELTASLTNLQNALSLTSDPAVKARINDFVAYVHFLALYYEYSIGQRMRDCQVMDNTTFGTPDALIQYMWRINDRDMVQAYYMMNRIISPPASTGLRAHPELGAKWNSSGTGAGWNTIGTPIDDTTLGNLLACDSTPPPDPQCNTIPGGSPICNSTCPCPAGEDTWSEQACVAAVDQATAPPPNSSGDPISLARQIGYVSCIDPSITSCYATLGGTANFDRRAAALQYVAGSFTPSQYLAITRDRSRKLNNAHLDPTLLAAYCAGDDDSDLVPNSLDTCPNTPPLTATNDSGCTDTTLPLAPPRAAVDAMLGKMGVVYNPNCVGAPAPTVPIPSAVCEHVSLPTPNPFTIALTAVSNQPAGCEVFYQVRAELLSVDDGPSPGQSLERSALFYPPAKQGTTLPNPPGGAADVTLDVTSWQHFEVFTRISARAMNGNGSSSAWSSPVVFRPTACE
jgi:hypothetical protein